MIAPGSGAPRTLLLMIAVVPVRDGVLPSGADETIVHGSVDGLRTGAELSHVTIARGDGAGVRVVSADPTIEDCVVRKNRGGGIVCIAASPQIRRTRIVANGSRY